MEQTSHQTNVDGKQRRVSQVGSEPRWAAEAESTPRRMGHRVLFVAPATLSFVGYDETFDVSIQNLSDGGLSCRGPIGLRVGDNLLLEFRFTPAGPMELFKQVVCWAARINEEEALYGFRFAGALEPEQDARLRSALDERSRGQAAEWTLPLLPDSMLGTAYAQEDYAVDASTRGSKSGVGLSLKSLIERKESWVAAGIGFAFGILLALVFVALTPTATRPAGPRPGVPNAFDEAPRASSRSTADTGRISPSRDKTHQAPEKLFAALAPAKDNALDRQGVAPSVDRVALPLEPLRIEGGGDKASLLLVADGPIGETHTFWMNHPQRLVVELVGRQSGLDRSLYEFTHPIFERVRVARFPAKVRFVIETGKGVPQQHKATARKNVLRLELTRKG